MNNYLIQISFVNPYPINLEFQEKAGSFATATNRAIKKWRGKYKGKRIKKINIVATQL